MTTLQTREATNASADPAQEKVVDDDNASFEEEDADGSMK